MSPKLPTLVCKRCGHVWTPRVSKPVQCPMCRSRIWKKVKEEKVKENIPPDEQVKTSEVVVVGDEIVEEEAS